MASDPTPPRDGTKDSVWRTDSLLFQLCLFGGGLFGLLWGLILSASGVIPMQRPGFVGGLVGTGLGLLVGGFALGIIDMIRQTARSKAARARCPSCAAKVNIPEEFAGREVKCPMCQAAFTAPTLPPG